MTTTVHIKRKLNIQERQNRPSKVKRNYSKVNDSIKTNKISNIVNVIKDTSQSIIDKVVKRSFSHLIVTIQQILWSIQFPIKKN